MKPASIKMVAVCAAAMVLSGAARAGLFDDDEARKQIKLLGEKVEAQNKQNDERFLKLDESIKNLGIIQLLNQIEALNTEISRLRGQIEVLANQNEQLQKRQKDFYFDIDARLRGLEGGTVAAPATNINLQQGSGVSANNAPNSAPTSVIANQLPTVNEAALREREDRAYDVGAAAIRRGDFVAAIRAYQTFMADYPQSPLLPNAMYWIGLAQFNLKEYRDARATQESLLKRFPDTGKAADAMLVAASAQAELGDAGSARNTFEDIIAKYPMSDAAAKARTRLGGVRR